MRLIAFTLVCWALLVGKAWHDFRCLQYETHLAETRMDAKEMEQLAQNLLNRSKLRLEYDPKTGTQRYHFEVRFDERRKKQVTK